MFPPSVLPSATLFRGVISKVVTLPSDSLHLPSHITSNTNKMPGVSSEISQKNIVSSQYNFRITQNSEDICQAPHGLIKQNNLSDLRDNRCVPVPVVMQTTCAVYAGGSGGPVIALHPSYGEFINGYVICFIV